jgi:hypothetical protein
MSSSHRLKKRQQNQAFELGSNWDSHYIQPFVECYPGDFAIPIGRPDGVKICVKNRPTEMPDPVVEAGKNGVKLNGLYKSYSPYNPPQQFQTRPFNPWPEGGMNRQEALLKDYIKVPIRYNGTGLENMGQISGQEFAYGWEVVNQPPTIPVQKLPWSIPSNSNPRPKNNYDWTRLHSSQQRGDLRNELYGKYKHPAKTDFYHTKQVEAVYPENRPNYTFIPGSIVTNI